MPPKNKYATTHWGKDLTVDLTVPSGQLCLVRRVGAPALIAAGFFDQLDILSSIVQTDHVDRVEKGVDPNDQAQRLRQAQELMGDKDKVLEALGLIDKVTEFVVLQPKLSRPVRRNEQGEPILVDGKEVPLPEDDRAPGAVYTDMVELEDKMFIFQYVVGGTSDLAKFREEFGAAVGGLEAKSVVSDAAQ